MIVLSETGTCTRIPCPHSAEQPQLLHPPVKTGPAGAELPSNWGQGYTIMKLPTIRDKDSRVFQKRKIRHIQSNGPRMVLEFSPATLETNKQTNEATVLKFSVKTTPHPDFKIKTASIKCE